jgi:hypothetical protein
VQAGADADVCTTAPRTIVTGWLHKHRACALPDPVVLVAAEPLVLGDPRAAQHRTQRDDGRTLVWQQTWIRGNLPQTRIDGYVVTIPDGRQVFVVASSATTRDAVLSGLSW